MDDRKGNSPEDQCFWTYSPKIISDPPLDTHLPEKQQKKLCSEWINHSDYEEPCKAVFDLSACMAVEYKMKDDPHGVRLSVMIRKVGLCEREMAISINMPARTKRSTKCLCTSLPSLECCWHLVQTGLCTSLLVLLFGTGKPGLWVKTNSTSSCINKNLISLSDTVHAWLVLAYGYYCIHYVSCIL